MRYNISHRVISLLLCLVIPMAHYAQPGRSHTPESIKHEAKFIEAQKQKMLGNKDEAIKLLEKLGEEVDTIGSIFYELGRMYAADNKFDKALKNIQKAVDLESDFQPFWEVKAQIEVQAGKDRESADSYRHLTNLDPKEQSYYVQWAKCFERMGDTLQAIAIWDSIQTKFGLSETIVRKKHTLYHGIGKTTKAEEILEDWVTFAPKQTQPLFQLAQYQERIGKPEEAIETYKQVLDMQPDHGQAKLALMTQQQSEGNHLGFLKSLEPIVQNEEAPIDLKIKQIIPFVERLADGDTSLAPALDTLAGMLQELHGDEAKTWSVSGDIAYYTGDKKRAAAYYKKTVELNPQVFPVWEQLLRTLAETHQYKQLVEQSEQARDYFPNQGLILYFQGLGHFGIGAYEEAKSILEEALLMSSSSPEMQADIYALLSAVASRTEEPETAEEYINEGLENVSNHPDLLLQKASFLIRNEQDLSEAERILNRVDKMVPHTVEMAHLRGWLELKKGQIQNASDLLSKALESSNYPSPELLEHFGDSLKEQGALQEAKKYWEQALDQGGNRSRLERKLQELPE